MSIKPAWAEGSDAPAPATATGEHEALLRKIARQRVTAGPSHREGGNTLYEIPAGWESAIMARDPAVRCVSTGFELEDALTDPDMATILVPRDAALTFTVVRRICARHGAEKTIFIEGGNDE